MPKLLDDEALSSYRRDGFYFPLRAMSAEEAKSYRQRLEAYEGATGEPIHSNYRHKVHLLFTWANELVHHPRILDAVEDVLGPNLLCWTTNFFIKEPNTSDFVSWHQDATYWGLSSDEVVTAFGRLGHWFASEDVFDMVPDIVTTAKGLTSGYVPMGAVLISDNLMEQVRAADDTGAVFSNGFTYSGHPVSAAAALKNIEIIERDGLLEHVREVSPYFQARLRELHDIPIVGDVRGMGLMACVECVISQESKEALKLDYEIGNRIDEHCQELGLIVRPLINMCVMSPPLVITKEQIDRLVERLREGILRAQKDVQKEGVWKG